MRKAKGKLDLQDLIDELLSATVFDDIPRCPCPIWGFPRSMSTTFCNTRCYQPCDDFKNFTFIIDSCSDIDCYHDQPCSECVVKINDYKVLMRGIKAIYTKRMQRFIQVGRVNKFTDKSNKTYKILKEKREARRGGN